MSISNDIKDILNSYTPISLKEMDSVALMNRIDTKYVFNILLLPELLKESAVFFQVLEIAGERMFAYNTTYYDTSGYSLFNNHLRGRLNRHKVRHRIYESTGVSYLEIKFKSNKNRTIKWRIKNEMNGHFDDKATSFLMEYTHMDAQSLIPVITNRFNRITLVSIENKTRITLDFGLSFKGSDMKNKELPYLAIAEVKQDGNNNHNPFVHLLRKRGIRQAGFSKYCMGSAMLYDIPRKNSLKPKFLQLKRIEQEYDAHTFGS
ncbi:MAG: polyphosphate polymerase domain-containing protein [Bacteroidales bacterium]|nr:polyphosphate polymerase domain-containing protein [Bacteroidales bacterium]